MRGRTLAGARSPVPSARRCPDPSAPARRCPDPSAPRPAREAAAPPRRPERGRQSRPEGRSRAARGKRRRQARVRKRGQEAGGCRRGGRRAASPSHPSRRGASAPAPFHACAPNGQDEAGLVRGSGRRRRGGAREGQPGAPHAQGCSALPLGLQGRRRQEQTTDPSAKQAVTCCTCLPAQASRLPPRLGLVNGNVCDRYIQFFDEYPPTIKSPFLKSVGNDPCLGDTVLALGIGKPRRQRAELALRLSVEKV